MLYDTSRDRREAMKVKRKVELRDVQICDICGEILDMSRRIENYGYGYLKLNSAGLSVVGQRLEYEMDFDAVCYDCTESIFSHIKSLKKKCQEDEDDIYMKFEIKSISDIY